MSGQLSFFFLLCDTKSSVEEHVRMHNNSFGMFSVHHVGYVLCVHVPVRLGPFVSNCARFIY